ncbi:hypothetical protein TSOC_014723, partial [Tetrabaena socialis]
GPLPYVFGLASSPSLGAVPALKAMLLRGLVRVALAWRLDGDPTVAAVCSGALAYLPSLQQLRPDFSLMPMGYTALEAGAPGFFRALAGRISGAEALVACDSPSASGQLMEGLVQAGARPRSMFLAQGPALDPFVVQYGSGGGAADYALSAVQWHRGVQYSDPFFGSAARYAAEFAAATGGAAIEDGAGASAAALVLGVAVRRAFGGCSISPEVLRLGDVGALLFDPAAITCNHSAPAAAATAAAAAAAEQGGGSGGGSGGAAAGVQALPAAAGLGLTGYQLVMRELDEGRFETFYGPVEFNAQRRNVAKPTVTTQVQGGLVHVVMPLEAADGLLMMPAPTAEGRK